MKPEELRPMSLEALNKQLEELREEFFNLRFQLSTRQLVNHREILRVKREIARIRTIIRERELGVR